MTSWLVKKWRPQRHTLRAVPPLGRPRVLLHSGQQSGPLWPNRCLHRVGPLWQPGSCSATPLVRRRRQTRTDNGVTTSIASSTWRRLPQVQRGGLYPGSTVVRAAHPVLCTHHP
jgi:hypothetical protein